jgi:hypothetical protein
LWRTARAAHSTQHGKTPGGVNKSFRNYKSFFNELSKNTINARMDLCRIARIARRTSKEKK